jgi:hypothetical protein
VVKMEKKEVWIKVGQTGTAPIVTVYKGPRGLRLVVSVAYYKKQNGNTYLSYFGSEVELYRGQKLLANGLETVKRYLNKRGIEYPLLD